MWMLKQASAAAWTGFCDMPATNDACATIATGKAIGHRRQQATARKASVAITDAATRCG